VVVERVQRRDREEAQALARLGVELVDGVEERRKRLSRPGRRLDQRVLPARDRRPPERLRRCRTLERALEPRARLGRERCERVTHEPRATRSLRKAPSSIGGGTSSGNGNRQPGFGTSAYRG